MSWIATVNEQISDLELIASWASQCGLGTVRDHIRRATADLRFEVERRERVGPVFGVCPSCGMRCFVTDGRSRCCDADATVNCGSLS